MFIVPYLSGSAQSLDTTLTKADYLWHQNDTKTWVFDLSGTLTDEDTLFIDGDTILNVYDTITFDFPNKFGNSFAGWLRFSTDTIPTYADVTGFYRLFQAACETCDYEPIIASTAITAPAAFVKTFDLHAIKLRAVFWTTGDTGTFEGNLVLKPSSISSD